MAYEKKYKDELLIIDFSQVREKASDPGYANRPASGPKPLMNAIERLATIKGANVALEAGNFCRSLPG